jgi:hypothetical protein
LIDLFRMLLSYLLPAALPEVRGLGSVRLPAVLRQLAWVLARATRAIDSRKVLAAGVNPAAS